MKTLTTFADPCKLSKIIFVTLSYLNWSKAQSSTVGKHPTSILMATALFQSPSSAAWMTTNNPTGILLLLLSTSTALQPVLIMSSLLKTLRQLQISLRTESMKGLSSFIFSLLLQVSLLNLLHVWNIETMESNMLYSSFPPGPKHGLCSAWKALSLLRSCNSIKKSL